MTPAEFIRAAEVFEREAEGIRVVHTLPDGEWVSDLLADPARMDHDEMLSLAAKLREEAEKR